MEFAFQLAVGIGGTILLPLMFALFAKFNAMSKEMVDQAKAINKLELEIAKEYISRPQLKEIIEPLQSRVISMDRLLERIADKLHIPAVNDR